MGGVYGTPDIRITVTEVQGSGNAPCGYQPGDSWLVTDLRAPEGLCTWAIASIAPYLATLRFGGSVPWEDDKDRIVACCSDAANPVAFELRRLPAS